MADTTSTQTFVLYHYNPSKIAAIMFIGLFVASSVYHAFQLFKMKTWYFIPFVIGGFFEVIGYSGRWKSATQSPDWTTGPYIAQSLMTLLAPTLFAASIYMVLGRIIRLTNGEEHSLISARWLTKVFVLGDVLSFLAQSGGGGMLAKAKDADAQKLGTNIITGGLFIQVIFFGIFIIVAGQFHVRIYRNPTNKSLILVVPWARYLYILYIASGFIMVRSIYRIAEYIQGSDGVLMSTEVYLYLFDATIMFLTMALFNVFHPSVIISRDSLKADWQPGTMGGSYGYHESMSLGHRGAV